MSEDVFDLLPEMELAKKETILNTLIQDWQTQVLTSEEFVRQCDHYQLWPKWDEFVAIFVAGYVERQKPIEGSGTAFSSDPINYRERSLSPATPPYMAEISAYPAGGER